jgi:hypothetical protein
MLQDPESIIQRVLAIAEQKPVVILALALGVGAATFTGINWPHRWPNWTAWTGATATGLSVISIALAAVPVYKSVRQWIAIEIDPPIVVVSCSGGRVAVVTIENGGAAIAISVRGRVIDSGNADNPSPMWTHCPVFVVEQKRVAELLPPGSVGHITIAEFIEGYMDVPVHVFGRPLNQDITVVKAELRLLHGVADAFGAREGRPAAAARRAADGRTRRRDRASRRTPPSLRPAGGVTAA